MSELTSEIVRKLFDYCDGQLLWYRNPNKRWLQIMEAGAINSSGYVVVTIDGKKHYAHKLVWLWHGLELPQQIDHIDRDKTNNRIENLRAATYSTNACNAKLRSDNKSGVKGVSWCSTYNKWTVQLWANKKKITGRFKSLSDAVDFANAKRAELHGDFACFGG